MACFAFIAAAKHCTLVFLRTKAYDFVGFSPLDVEKNCFYSHERLVLVLIKSSHSYKLKHFIKRHIHTYC